MTGESHIYVSSKLDSTTAKDAGNAVMVESILPLPRRPQPMRSDLPAELKIMILTYMNGLTMTRCRQLNKTLKELIDSEPSLQSATFGLRPRNVMLNVISHLLDSDEEPSDDSRLPEAYRTALAFGQLNSTYHAFV